MNVNPDHSSQILIKVLPQYHPFLIHTSFNMINLVPNLFHHIIKHVLSSKVDNKVWKKCLLYPYNISVARCNNSQSCLGL